MKEALQNRHQESEHDMDHFQTSFETGTQPCFQDLVSLPNILH